MSTFAWLLLVTVVIAAAAVLALSLEVYRAKLATGTWQRRYSELLAATYPKARVCDTCSEPWPCTTHAMRGGMMRRVPGGWTGWPDHHPQHADGTPYEPVPPAGPSGISGG